VVGLVLSNVTFSVANSILRDDGSGAYPPPHWTATNSYPVTCPRNTTGTVSATFWVVPTNCVNCGSVIIRGDGTGGLNIPATTCTVASATTVTMPATEFVKAFPNQVDYLNPLTINWKYSGGDSTFYDAGASENPVYITLTNPATANLYRTVVHLACSVAGAQDAVHAVIDTWSQFTSGGTGPSDLMTWDGKELYYYQNGSGWNTASSVAGLLSSQNGNCVAWRNLLLHALLVNGVSSDRVYIDSTDPLFLVRAWGFGSSSFTNTPPYNWKLQFPTTAMDTDGLGVYGDLTNLVDIAGQNTTPPAEKVFGNHRILRVGIGNICLDPSYGVTFSDENDFVDTAVAGYAGQLGSDNPSGSTNLILRVKQSTGVYEINFTINDPADPSD